MWPGTLGTATPHRIAQTVLWAPTHLYVDWNPGYGKGGGWRMLPTHVTDQGSRIRTRARGRRHGMHRRNRGHIHHVGSLHHDYTSHDACDHDNFDAGDDNAAGNNHDNN